jgi:hypothetical protein
MTASIQLAKGNIRLTGDWLRAADLPTSRGLSRGYDRRSVDALLAQCANGVDRLSVALIGAHNEIDRLTEVNSHRRLVRAAGRPTLAGRHRRRSPQQQVAARTKLARLRSAATR